jgi:hypothetical protein
VRCKTAQKAVIHVDFSRALKDSSFGRKAPQVCFAVFSFWTRCKERACADAADFKVKVTPAAFRARTEQSTFMSEASVHSVATAASAGSRRARISKIVCRISSVTIANIFARLTLFFLRPFSDPSVSSFGNAAHNFCWQHWLVQLTLCCFRIMTPRCRLATPARDGAAWNSSWGRFDESLSAGIYRKKTDRLRTSLHKVKLTTILVLCFRTCFCKLCLDYNFA